MFLKFICKEINMAPKIRINLKKIENSIRFNSLFDYKLTTKMLIWTDTT